VALSAAVSNPINEDHPNFASWWPTKVTKRAFYLFIARYPSGFRQEMRPLNPNANVGKAGTADDFHCSHAI
jgi:hypothetical protein